MPPSKTTEICMVINGHVQRCKHLDENDDDYLFLDMYLDRYGDRRVPKDKPHPTDYHNRLLSMRPMSK